MFRQFAAAFRRFAHDSEGAAAIEYALLLPTLLMFSFGILEISLCMASLVTLEGGLKEASRYGITSQTPTAAQLTAIQAQIPTSFSGADDRTKQIMAILNQNTLDLIDLNTATITTQTFDSFSVVKNGEPFTDLNGNNQYDGPGSPGVPAAGEPYSDMNCNGVRDAAGASGSSAGAAGSIVVYTVNYNWKIMTPIVGQFLGKPDVAHPGKYIIPMQASIVVKNEPQFSGSSFCS